jgi:hypothetical protein
MLNMLERSAARNLFESTGIRGTYIFAEYQASKIDGFGSGGFDLSDDTWSIGFYVEL